MVVILLVHKISARLNYLTLESENGVQATINSTAYVPDCDPSSVMAPVTMPAINDHIM